MKLPVEDQEKEKFLFECNRIVLEWISPAICTQIMDRFEFILNSSLKIFVVFLNWHQTDNRIPVRIKMFPSEFRTPNNFSLLQQKFLL